MQSLLLPQIASDRTYEMHQRARFARVAARVRKPSSQSVPVGTFAVRVAHEDDAAVRRLAALDSSRVPEGQVLMAVLDGEPVAAISLSDRHVVADPFAHTANAVALLRMRAEQISTAETASLRRRALRLRVRRTA